MKVVKSKIALYVCTFSVLIACSKLLASDRGDSPEEANVENSSHLSAEEPSGQDATTQDQAPETKQQKPAYSKIESRLLDQAELAFRKGNFFYPSHNNAYDRFQSVLLINPQNQEARTGVQAILLRYTNVTRDAIANGRLSSAENYLREVESYFPDNPIVLDLKRKLQAKRRHVPRPREQLMVAEKNLEYEDIRISKSELGQKTDAMVEVLGLIAKRLQETDESILIFARSDREGRWMYQQMKEAVDGYRIRGDIRISQSPKIRILPPL